MNTDVILSAKPSIALDYLIAEHVMDWRRYDTFRDQAHTEPIVEWIRPDRQYPGELRLRFSRDIEAAWLIADRLRTLAAPEHRNIIRVQLDNTGWTCEVWQPAYGHTIAQPSAPLAICKAALIAVLKTREAE